MEKRYTVRQAAEITAVKPYVLRYWEDELELAIKRNEMGHRYYTDYDIQLFMNIKELKAKGLQLKAIKTKILDLEKNEEKEELTDTLPITDKIIEFQQIIEKLINYEITMKNSGEERCRTLDAAIRRQQIARKEIAATSDRKRKK